MGLFGSRNKKRGLLGDTMWDGAQTPGYGDGANQHWDIANMPAPMQGAPQDRQPSFWQGGGKFGLRDWIAGILAAIGDGLAQQGGGQGGAVQMLAGGRMDAMDMARKAQMEAQQRQQAMQALIAAGIDPARANLGAMGLASYGDLAPKPTEAPSDVRVAEWYRTATPEQRASYDQTRPIITNGYGSTVVPRSALPRGGGPQPGAIEDGYQFMGGNPSDPNSWKPVGGGGGNVTSGFRR